VLADKTVVEGQSVDHGAARVGIAIRKKRDPQLGVQQRRDPARQVGRATCVVRQPAGLQYRFHFTALRLEASAALLRPRSSARPVSERPGYRRIASGSRTQRSRNGLGLCLEGRRFFSPLRGDHGAGSDCPRNGGVTQPMARMEASMMSRPCSRVRSSITNGTRKRTTLE